MFKKMLLAVLAVAALVCGGAEKKSIVPKSTVPGKICLLVTDVGTIDTVAKTEEFLTKIKQFNISNTPSVSDADKAVDPTIAKREVNYRFNDNVRRYNEEQREIARQNRRMERIRGIIPALDRRGRTGTVSPPAGSRNQVRRPQGAVRQCPK